jgi:small subunit ribosomal protein S16
VIVKKSLLLPSKLKPKTMPTKIRLQRHGKKAAAFFHIVVADGRAPRDGKFIEKIGTYNPNTNPATIDIDHDSAFEWVKSGAQPTDTCRAILSYKGVMYRYHLHRGVVKGALSQDQADAKLAKWMEEKTSKVTGKVDGLAEARKKAEKERLAAESKSKEAKAAKIAAKSVVAEATTTEESTEAPAENAENNG